MINSIGTLLLYQSGSPNVDSIKKGTVENKVRDSCTDAVAGFFIWVMILVHMFQWAELRDSKIYAFLQYFNFFMPWFFFKAGLFYSSKGNLKKLCVKKAKRLLLPMVTFSLLGVVACIVYYGKFESLPFGATVVSILKGLVSSGSFVGNTPLWFLPCLFLVHVGYKILSYRRWLIVSSLIASVGLSNLLVILDINGPSYVVASVTGFIYFTFGVFYKRYQNSRILLQLFIGLCISVIIWLTNPTLVDMRTNSLIDGNYGLWYIVSISGIICIQALSKITPPRIIEVFGLQKFGYYSMILYVCHWPLLIMTDAMIGDELYTIENWHLFSLYLLTQLVMMPFCIYIFNLSKIKNIFCL